MPAISLCGLLLACAAYGQPTPLADHHQHLFGPGVTKASATLAPITARDLVALLNAAGIQRAVVLSVAYMLGSPGRTIENEHDAVRTENDWTGEQAARFPDRLIAFCSFNPLKDYALEELARCSKDPRLRAGLKLHFGNSAVDYHNPRHVERLRQIFRAANRHRMPVAVHMRASISRKLAYGRDEALIFLNELLPEAPDIPVQIAHLAGAGGYADPLVDNAAAVFVEAIAKGDPRTRRLYFDATAVALRDLPDDRARLAARRIRELGVQRILYGSDAAAGGNLPPREGWAAFLRLPLSEDEFRTIAGNVPAYLRR